MKLGTILVEPRLTNTLELQGSVDVNADVRGEAIDVVT